MIKKYIRSIRRNLIFVKSGFVPKVCKHPGIEYFGTEYGGWPVIKSLLDSSSAILSFGLGEDISFDRAMVNEFGTTVHGFDPTPKSAKWIKSQTLPDSFQFHEYGIAKEDGVLTFNAPENEGFASWSATHQGASEKTISLPVKSLASIAKELNLETIDVLKMDIEGSENEVIDSLVSSELRPVQILVEFHHRIHKTDFAETLRAIRDLEAIGYTLFYISDLGDEYAFVLAEAIA